MMKICRLLLLVAILIGSPGQAFAKDSILYKEVGEILLFMEVYKPSPSLARTHGAAIVFFFGGGWKRGTIRQFENHAKYFSNRGLTCFLADYRTEDTHGTSPFESLKDAKSAIRFIRKNAKRFGIDPDLLIASGGSAGGHLAAATALISRYNEKTDDISISAIPNALVLFNPVIDNGPAGYGYERIREAYPDFSPLHNIKEGAPPTLILLGTKDKLVPVETVQYYKKAMEMVGSRCDLRLYDGETHGFFNYKFFPNYKKTVQAMDHFLVSLEFLKPEPTISIE